MISTFFRKNLICGLTTFVCSSFFISFPFLFHPMFPSTFYILSYFYLSCQLLFCEVIYNLLLIHLFPLLINAYPSYLLLINPYFKNPKILMIFIFWFDFISKCFPTSNPH